MSAYLDHAATAGMSAAALAAYDAAATVVGNPSSLHANGRAARNIVEDARESIAANLGAHPTEVVFTSGGTESNNLAIKGIYWAQTAQHPQRNTLLISAMEHHSVLAPARWLEKHGANLKILPVTSQGQVQPETLNTCLHTTISVDARSAFASAPEQDNPVIAQPALVGENLVILRPRAAGSAESRQLVALVSVLLASNEIGTIEPIRELSELAHSAGAPMHTDAVAALGQIPISFAELGVDALSVAAHKIGGPHGVGALLVKRGLAIEPLHHGGDHERGLRAGTINVPGVAAFAAALSEATANLTKNQTHQTWLREQLIKGVQTQILTAILTGPPSATPATSAVQPSLLGAQRSPSSRAQQPPSSCAQQPPSSCAQQPPSSCAQSQDLVNPNLGNRLPGNASFVFPGTDPDALLFGLDNAGFAASIGAACAAGVAQASGALLACGFSDADARLSLRFTLGPSTTEQEVEQLVRILPAIVAAASLH